MSENNSRSLGREAITVSTTEVSLPVHRTDGTPTLFAGFREGWLSATAKREAGQVECELLTGMTGYLLIHVTLPDGRTVYEYANMSEFFQARIAAILKEKGIN
jgi:hypothetical protein